MLWHYSRCIEYIGFLWICITVPFQILLLIAILRRFNYFKINKSFYLFYVINTFMDLSNLFCVCFGMLFPAWGFFIPAYINIGSNLGKWLLIASFWSRMSQGIACLIIAVNRCSAILYPLSYEKIWNRTLISIAVFVQIFAGAPFAAFAANKEYLWYVNISTAVEYNIKLEDLVIEQNHLYWDQIQILKVIWRNASDKVAIFVVGFVVETSCCILLIFAYCIMGGVLWYRNKKARNAINTFYTPNPTQRTKINQQLFKMAAWVCTLEILFTLFLAIIVTIKIHPNLFYALYNTLSILYSTLNPYILIFCSHYTRNLLLETIFDVRCFFIKKIVSHASTAAAGAMAIGGMPSQQNRNKQNKSNLKGNNNATTFIAGAAGAATQNSGSIITITTFER